MTRPGPGPHFWEHLDRFGARPALIGGDGDVVTYSALEARVAEVAAQLRDAEGSLSFLYLENNFSSIVALLACLRSSVVPLLLSKGMRPEARSALVERYRPDWVFNGADEATHVRIFQANSGSAKQYAGAACSAELGLLLSTSGTTASPKLVRISWRGLQANAESIASYLGIGAGDRALTVLPPSYSYGLSVITSHLNVGASLVVTEVGVLTRQFVATIQERDVTSISGVPYTYQMLHRTGFGREDMPSLRVLTQAGGRLDDALTREFSALSMARGWRFFVMYGQTEATARISYVPPERLLSKVGSIGITIPGGQLSVDKSSGELVYQGPNVALGYASSREDLARGDDFAGVLRTGDLGRQDPDGFFYITGRISRFIKVAGNRVGLDEVEHRLQAALRHPVAVTGRDDLLIVAVETPESTGQARVRRLITDEFRIHHSLYRILEVNMLPVLENGKKDYARILAMGRA